MLGTCLNYFSARRMRDAGLGTYNHPSTFVIGASGPRVYVKFDHIAALEPRQVHGAVVKQPGFRMKAARGQFFAPSEVGPSSICSLARSLLAISDSTDRPVPLSMGVA